MSSGEASSPASRPYYDFAPVAREYEATRLLPAAVADALAARLCDGLGSDDWLLDAGFGTGRLGRALARRHPGRVVGADISREMLLQGATIAAPDESRAHLVQADLRALPFPTGAFAGVLLVHVLHLIADWRKALDEVWRVVRPGGGLFLGYEDRSRTGVRELYMSRARKAGLLPRQVGGRSSEAVAHLAERYGVEAAERRYPDLRWSYDAAAGETFGTLERRLFSQLWDIPEGEHRRLLEETRARARELFGREDWEGVEEHVDVQLTLYEVRKPS